jgi:carbamoyl-phosphate synthase large subunit
MVKQRAGEGSAGVLRVRPEEAMRIDMTGCISQEFLHGDEYSIDALCDRQGDPIYIVPRQRCVVRSGRSVVGKVVDDVGIVSMVRRILAATRFLGPVNVQCFRTADGLFFTDLNPRVSGGLSLSLAATENWFRLIPRLLLGRKICPKPIIHGLVMMRYLTETVIDQARLMQ